MWCSRLDGRKEVHDRFRKDYAGRGSYDTIVPNFQRFVAKRGDKSYYMRGTYTHYNTDFTKDIFHMADLGFTELSMEPVVCDPADPCALTEEDLPILMEQYEILAREMLRRHREGRPFTFYHYILDLKNGPCIYKRISGCGSGTEYMAVTPWGELFPCHQFVGDPKYSLGNIWEGVKTRKPKTNSGLVTPMPGRNAKTAGPSYTALAAAQPTATMPPAPFKGSTLMAVNCSKNGSNAPSCSKWPWSKNRKHEDTRTGFHRLLPAKRHGKAPHARPQRAWPPGL